MRFRTCVCQPEFSAIVGFHHSDDIPVFFYLPVITVQYLNVLVKIFYVDHCIYFGVSVPRVSGKSTSVCYSAHFSWTTKHISCFLRLVPTWRRKQTIVWNVVSVIGCVRISLRRYMKMARVAILLACAVRISQCWRQILFSSFPAFFYVFNYSFVCYVQPIIIIIKQS